MPREDTRQGEWVVRKSARGFDVEVYVWTDSEVAQINHWYMKTCVYLYASEEGAKKGEKAGGSGCLVYVPSETRLHAPPHLYVVTNRHVIEKDKCTFMRYNVMPEGFDITPTAGTWTWDKKDDLAVASVKFPKWVHYFAMDLKHEAATHEKIQQYNINIGDDVFMISRFIGHEGKERNKPVARFGNISMMPDPHDPVETGEGKQEAYLVEMRSVGGASGSPVFWSVPNHRAHVDGENGHMARADLYGPILLGIDCGHFLDPTPVLDGDDEPHPHGWYTKGNSGMAVVIPVWRIRRLLDKQEFVMARKKEDERRANQEKLQEKRGRFEADSKRPQSEGITQEGFDEALRRASRKIPAPDEETRSKE
jgi:hypothetical protein